MARHLASVAPAGAVALKVFPPFDAGTFAPQLVWLTVSFGLLYLLLRRIVVPRVSGAIEERNARIKLDLAEAERIEVETTQALADHDKALADARARASNIGKRMRADVANEVAAERAKVEGQIAQSIAEAEERIAGVKGAALASVSDMASDVAAAIVARLTGQQVSEDEVRNALARQAAE